jgi:hypothetical protein
MAFIWNGVAAGALIALFAISFSTVYLSTRVFHIALAAIMTAAPFIALSYYNRGGSGILVVRCNGLLRFYFTRMRID